MNNIYKFYLLRSLLFKFVRETIEILVLLKYFIVNKIRLICNSIKNYTFG